MRSLCSRFLLIIFSLATQINDSILLQKEKPSLIWLVHLASWSAGLQSRHRRVIHHSYVTHLFPFNLTLTLHPYFRFLVCIWERHKIRLHELGLSRRMHGEKNAMVLRERKSFLQSVVSFLLGFLREDTRDKETVRIYSKCYKSKSSSAMLAHWFQGVTKC